MKKVANVPKAQLSFLDMDSEWFSFPTAKPILNPEALQLSASPDQILRGFTVKLLSSMGVSPEGSDIKDAVRQASLQKRVMTLGCPKKYAQIAVEALKDLPSDVSIREIWRTNTEYAPATRSIRVSLLKKEHPDWLNIWTTAETDIMGGKADLLDYHLHPANPDVFVKKMQEIGDVNDPKHYLLPYTILAYTCIDEAEYEAVKKGWEKLLLTCSHERDPMQMENFLSIYGIYRKYGRYHDLPSNIQCSFDILTPSHYSNWLYIEEMLNLDSFPFRVDDAYNLNDKERYPGDFGPLQKEETALHAAMHGGNYVGE